jgi:hypothetical protein
MPQIVLNELKSALENSHVSPELAESQFDFFEKNWQNPFPVGAVSQKMTLF